MLLLLVPCALALLVVAVVGLAGFGPLTDDRRAARDGLLGSVGPAVVLLGGVVLLVIGVAGTFLLAGIGGGGGEEPPDVARDREVATTTTTTTAVDETRPVPSAAETRDRGPGVLGPLVWLQPADESVFPDAPAVVDGLSRGMVLPVRVTGFEPFAVAVAEQCAPTPAGVVQCFNQAPVQFGESGVAQFQYLLSPRGHDDRITGRCRPEGGRCTLVVRAADRGTRAEIQTVFGDEPARAGTITVSSTTDLAVDGETVVVSVRDYPPGVTVDAMLCAAPDASGARCGAPGPTAPLEVGPDGRGRTRLVLRTGTVGAARASCGRGDVCGVSVASPTVFVGARVVPVTFAAPPGAAYDPTRLLLGLGLAALLVAIATWLIVRTDWSAVGEAAAPEIDEAEYADLDAIIAALPPEEEEADVLAHR